MTLTDADRSTIEIFAKEAAMRHYRSCNQRASEAEAFAFAARSWRQPDYVQAGCDCLALFIAIDEAAAAVPFN